MHSRLSYLFLSSHHLPMSAAFHPKKSLGQNFLVDGVHLARIVAAADLAPTDQVLEIGPGTG